MGWGRSQKGPRVVEDIGRGRHATRRSAVLTSRPRTRTRTRTRTRSRTRGASRATRVPLPVRVRRGGVQARNARSEVLLAWTLGPSNPWTLKLDAYGRLRYGAGRRALCS